MIHPDIKQIIFLLILAAGIGFLVTRFSATGQNRVAEYLAGWQDPTNASYHVQRSFEAIIKGGVFGVGLGEANTKLLGLPFAPTDSVFAVIVEELGLFGSVLLIGLYAALVWRGLVTFDSALLLLGGGYLSAAVFEYILVKDRYLLDGGAMRSAFAEAWPYGRWSLVGVTADIFKKRSYLYLVTAIPG